MGATSRDRAARRRKQNRKSALGGPKRNYLLTGLVECGDCRSVVMAQDLLPESRGTVSGLIMGLGWSTGGLLVGAVGGLAEAYGLVNVLSWMLVLIVPALGIAIALPGRLGRPDAGVEQVAQEIAGRTKMDVRLRGARGGRRPRPRCASYLKSVGDVPSYTRRPQSPGTADLCDKSCQSSSPPPQEQA